MNNVEQSEKIANAEINLYTEIETSRIYEGKLFEDFVLVRPVLPSQHADIKKVPIVQFAQTFDDFQGDRAEVRAFLTGTYQPMTIN